MKVVTVILVILLLGTGGAVGFYFFQLQQAQQNITKMSMVVEKMTAEVEDSQNTITGLNAEIVTLKADADKNRTRLVQAVEEKKSAEAKIKATEDAMAKTGTEAAQKAADLTKTIEGLKARLDKAGQENAGLTGKVADLEKKNASLTAEIKAAGEKNSAMAKDLAQNKAVADKATSRRLTWEGTLLLENAKAKEAMLAFQGAFVADGTNADACKGMALCAEILGDTAQARAGWENFIKLGPAEDELQTARQHLESLKE